MAAPSTSSSSTINIMLAIFEKKTTSVDLYHPLRNYIAFNYSEREAQNLEDDLQTLKQYRSDLERQPDPDSDFPVATSCRITSKPSASSRLASQSLWTRTTSTPSRSRGTTRLTRTHQQ
uniref:BRO1 domain-containing protein n=1 Tax=Fagus sylvatica TaxID=28930 RepID=A0A2N9FZ64_FAGSY